MKILLLFLTIFCSSAFAHKSSDSYLKIESLDSEVLIHWEIAIRDLENDFSIDKNEDGKITWSEIQSREKEFYNYTANRLDITSNGSVCEFNYLPIQINYNSDGAYLVLNIQSPCVLSNNVMINYRLFFDIDAQHRGLLNLTKNDIQVSHVFSPDETQFEFSLENTHYFSSFYSFLVQGIWHIWIGFDHILFLLSLLLPAVLIRKDKVWCATGSFKVAILDVIKIVTAFTIAHSLTLAGVILANVSLPVTLVESVIALSVITVALNNFYPVLTAYRWQLGFGFGLIHGFGFANVLNELHLAQQTLLVSLVGFNAGVEIGQLAIVMIFLPLAFAWRKHWVYEKLVLKYGSLGVAGLGFLWLLERSV